MVPVPNSSSNSALNVSSVTNNSGFKIGQNKFKLQKEQERLVNNKTFINVNLKETNGFTTDDSEKSIVLCKTSTPKNYIKKLSENVQKSSLIGTGELMEENDKYANINNETLLAKKFSNYIEDSKSEDIEELSSGYYSSYQSSSVDVISSSDLSNTEKIFKKTQKIPNTTSDVNLKPSQISSVIQPIHHYHTRYYSNYLSNKTINVKIQKNIVSVSKLTPRCTRYRYQQQNLAANSNSSNDLDLFLIEND